jgi:hypothetical protein
MRVGWARAWKMLALYVRSFSCIVHSIFDSDWGRLCLPPNQAYRQYELE